MNPWLILAVVLGWGTSVGGAFFYGEGVGESRQKAAQADRNDLVREVREASQKAAADEIAKIKPRNVTIRQELEREIQTNTVYRECRIPAGGVRLANEAITGRPESAGGGELSRTDAPADGP